MLCNRQGLRKHKDKHKPNTNTNTNANKNTITNTRTTNRPKMLYIFGKEMTKGV